MYETIVLPTDGSEHARRAAEHGSYLARQFDATVHVITAVDVRETSRLVDVGGSKEHVASRLRAEGQDVIETTEAIVGDREEVRTAVIEGKPAEAILEYADEHGADLLVMGTAGRTGLRRYVAGSVTERVVRLADVPVLTVRSTAGSSADYEEVLVPTDGSEAAAAAVDHGLAIARQAGARVHAVNVVDVADVAAHTRITPPTDLIARLESEGQEATDAIATRAREAGLEAVTDVHEGFPAKDLLEYAGRNDIDLIAMGTAGRTGIDRFLVGSTTERLVRHASMPVLAVNARRRSD